MRLWRQRNPPKSEMSHDNVDESALADFVLAAWSRRSTDGIPPLSGLARLDGPVYVAARCAGRRLADAWGTGESTQAALADAIRQISNQVATGEADTLELVLTCQARSRQSDREPLLPNIQRGVRGLVIQRGEHSVRYAPTFMLATNRSRQASEGVFRRQFKLSEADMRQAELGTFEAAQWLVSVKAPIEISAATRVVAMQRGSRTVPMTAVTRAGVEAFARRATDWMIANLRDNGRMTYKYWPSIRKESDANNMIRQWMATLALIRAARHWQDETLMERAKHNIHYNLKAHYQEKQGYGLVEWNRAIKLGALALAALALETHPARATWQRQRQALQRSVAELWQPNGSFRTFVKPPHRNDCQNFYPGEALVYWARLFEESQDTGLHVRFMTSFYFYRKWHRQRQNRNPAFIPWHTMAYCRMWRLTRDDELADFVFEMNDWLVEHAQQTERTAPTADTIGRFYNPDQPWGPPHASSTGVYLEGLIEAYRLAVACKQRKRARRYRAAIKLGLRSAMQLQFKDEVDMFYVPEDLRDRVRGGLRTTVYHNEIRCDNVQHNLMAAIEILATFSDRDFA